MTKNIPNKIPRSVLFGNPDRAMLRLSPDGRWIAFLAPVDDVLNVWVAPVDDLDAAKPITHDTVRDIRHYTWTYTNQYIVYLQDVGGDENWHAHSVHIESGEVKDLTPFEGVQARPQEVSDEFPDEILLGLNQRDPQFHDLYRANVRTGELTLVLENENYMFILTDQHFQPHFAARMTPDGGNEIFHRNGQEWESYLSIAMEDMMTNFPVGLDKAGQTLYMTDSQGRDTAALVAIDIASKQRTILAENEQADVSGTMIHPTSKAVEAVAFTYARKEWQILDPSIKGDLDYLATVADGEVEIVSRTHKDDAWLVAYQMDNGPVRYYYYDRSLPDQEKRTATFLFTNQSQLEGLPLAKMHPVVVQARDGLELICYYTLPIWEEEKASASGDIPAIPESPLPTILWVHGGPWARDEWGYSSIHQLFANRGYAVMSINYRGSTGLGKNFINAANLEWGGKMHDDLIDATNWAIEAGIADRDRIAITGGSYGGYATLAGMTFTPNVFACGVDIVGPSDLVSFIEAIPEYWKSQYEVLAKRVGDPRTEEGRQFLLERSPLTHVDNIARPLLIGQGGNDPRVKQAESDQIVEAMQAKQIPVTYVLYPDEGHGFARLDNRLSFFGVMEAFLAKHLEQERFEPVDQQDLAGSTMQILAGAGDVPGLNVGEDTREQS